jgi:beta-glucosidase
VHLIISDMVEETSQVTTPRAALRHYLGASRFVMPKAVTSSKNGWRVRRSSRATAAGKPMQQSPVSQISPDPRGRACRAGDVWWWPAWAISPGCSRAVPWGRFRYRSLNLPGVQQQLLEALVDTGKPVLW